MSDSSTDEKEISGVESIDHLELPPPPALELGLSNATSASDEDLPSVPIIEDEALPSRIPIIEVNSSPSVSSLSEVSEAAFDDGTNDEKEITGEESIDHLELPLSPSFELSLSNATSASYEDSPPSVPSIEDEASPPSVPIIEVKNSFNSSPSVSSISEVSVVSEVAVDDGTNNKEPEVFVNAFIEVTDAGEQPTRTSHGGENRRRTLQSMFGEKRSSQFRLAPDTAPQSPLSRLKSKLLRTPKVKQSKKPDPLTATRNFGIDYEWGQRLYCTVRIRIDSNDPFSLMFLMASSTTDLIFLSIFYMIPCVILLGFLACFITDKQDFVLYWPKEDVGTKRITLELTLIFLVAVARFLHRIMNMLLVLRDFSQCFFLCSAIRPHSRRLRIAGFMCIFMDSFLCPFMEVSISFFYALFMPEEFIFVMYNMVFLEFVNTLDRNFIKQWIQYYYPRCFIGANFMSLKFRDGEDLFWERSDLSKDVVIQQLTREPQDGDTADRIWRLVMSKNRGLGIGKGQNSCRIRLWIQDWSKLHKPKNIRTLGATYLQSGTQMEWREQLSNDQRLRLLSMFPVDCMKYIFIRTVLDLSEVSWLSTEHMSCIATMLKAPDNPVKMLRLGTVKGLSPETVRSFAKAVGKITSIKTIIFPKFSDFTSDWREPLHACVLERSSQPWPLFVGYKEEDQLTDSGSCTSFFMDATSDDCLRSSTSSLESTADTEQVLTKRRSFASA